MNKKEIYQEISFFYSGVVIRSMQGRFIVKRKIEQFSETKYKENDFKKTDKLGEEKEKDSSYYVDVRNNITTNRLDNSISKVGDITIETNKIEIIELMADDILFELNAHHVKDLREYCINEITKFITNKEKN
jgi:hypothetical protein